MNYSYILQYLLEKKVNQPPLLCSFVYHQIQIETMQIPALTRDKKNWTQKNLIDLSKEKNREL